MNIQEALLTFKKVCRPHWRKNDCFQYFEAKTGPHKHLVDCDYFVINESVEEFFSTSIDLYPEDLMASDYEVVDET